MAFVDDLLRILLPRPSAWRLASSGSGDVSVGVEKFVYVSATGGTLYMGMGASSHAFPFKYGGAGAGGGVGLSTLVAVSGSFSASSFPSTGGEFGRLYLPPWVTTDVNIDTIPGPAMLVSLSASLIAGGYFQAVFFGAQMGAFLGAPTPTSILASTNAVAFQIGSAITTSYAAGVTGYQLLITGAGKMT